VIKPKIKLDLSFIVPELVHPTDEQLKKKQEEEQGNW
jgi:hypothetical protein